MTIYIIRPKAKLVAQSLSLGSRTLTPESRRKQTQQVEAIYREDSSYQTLTEWAEFIKEEKNVKILKGTKNLGVTGTMIIEMTEEEAEESEKESSSLFSVIKDEFHISTNQVRLLIEPDKVTTSSKSENNLTDDDLWHLKAIKHSLSSQVTGKGITIAVLDTGIDSSHPALRGKITKSFELDREQLQVKELANSLDTSGHGTHVAGLICGTRIGVAPNAKLINGLVFPKGEGGLVNFIRAFEWVANYPEVQILNISAGLPGFIPIMEDMVSDLLAVGILPVCASGNDGPDYSCSPGNHRSVVSVGASNNESQVWHRSGSAEITINHHAYKIPHLVAPGEAVYSSVVQGGYEAWNGTSMATPIVSGVAALLLEKYPNLTVSKLRAELLRRCKLLEEPKERQGSGLIQVGDLS